MGVSGHGGLNTSVGYDVEIAGMIAEETGLPFVTAPNKFEALAAHDAGPGALGLSLRTTVPSLVRLLEDREPPVREEPVQRRPFCVVFAVKAASRRPPRQPTL